MFTLNRTIYFLFFLIFFIACRQDKPQAPATLRDIADRQVFRLCDSVSGNRDSLVAHKSKWVVDTLQQLSRAFPYGKDSATHALLCTELGRFYLSTHKYDSAYAITADVLPYFEAHPTFLKPLYTCYKILGVVMVPLKMNIFKANYYCTKAVAMCMHPETDSIFSLKEKIQALTAANITSHYCQMEEVSKQMAWEGYKLAKAHMKELPGNYDRLTQAYALALLTVKQYDSAGMYLREDEQWRNETRFSDPDLDNELANLKLNYFYCTKQYDSSLKYILQVDWDNLDPFQGAYTKTEIYTLLKRPAEAAQYLSAAMQMIKDYPDEIPEDEMKDFYHHKTRYEILYGDKKAAQTSFLVYDSLLEDLSSKERIKMLSSIESEYDLADKQKNIDRLNMANAEAKEKIVQKNNQLIIAVLAISLFAVTVVVILLLSRQRKLRSEKQLLAAQRHKAELEQRLLRTQMEPHFIFNTLSVMQNFIRNNENEKAIRYLQQFAALLRASLENSRENYVPLADEVEALRNYISLQAMRFENAFDYSLQLYEGYEKDNVTIPPMLLQPFVENAIYHGINNVRYKGNIVITMSKKGGSLHCLITDNGVGMHHETAGGRKSLAIRIARERLEIARKATGYDASVDIRNRPEGESGVIVELFIPYKKI